VAQWEAWWLNLEAWWLNQRRGGLMVAHQTVVLQSRVESGVPP
jgi:hypothetical protein